MPPFYSDPLKGKFYQMSSFVESKMERFVKHKELSSNFVIYSRRQISRVYPNGKRIDSTNYDPTSMWNAGSQLVSLNYQTPGEKMGVVYEKWVVVSWMGIHVVMCTG